MTQQGTIRNVQVSRRIWRIPCVNRTIWTVARAVWNFFENLPWASSIWLFWGGQNVGKMWTFVLQIIILTVTQYGKETGKKKWGPNHLQVFFSGVSKLPNLPKMLKNHPTPKKENFDIQKFISSMFFNKIQKLLLEYNNKRYINNWKLFKIWRNKD